MYRTFIPRCEGFKPHGGARASRLAFQSRSRFTYEGRGSKSETKNSLEAVRQHLLGLQHIGLAHLRQLLQLAHAARSFCAQDVALARVRANDLAARRDLKPLRGSAMRLQLQLWFRSIPWHC